MRLTTNRRTVNVAGHEVEISRTADGVAEIRGSDEQSLAAGIGLAHAVDRLVQIELVRLIGQGRLGECLRADDETLAIDIFAREMGFYEDASADVAHLRDETLGFVQAYADGVNHGITASRRPLELLLAGHRPTPWTPADTLVTVKLMSYVGLAQTQQDFEKLLIEAVRNGVDPDRLKKLVAPHLDGLNDEIVELIRGLKWLSPLLPEQLRRSQAMPSIKASNNWAVAPHRTADGTPLVCFDPHLEVNRLPGVWYETVMHTAGDSRVGVSMPGVPGLVMGRTRDLAFGFTYGFMDMIDYFIEDCSGGRCRRSDGTEPIQVHRQEIRRKGGQPVVIWIRSTSNGVLETEPDREELPDGLYLARAWSNHSRGASESLEALYELPTARTVAEAQRIARRVTISCNWVLADSRGSIGYQQSGRLPHRAHSGLHPVAGWDETKTWRGTISPDRLHSTVDPDEGFVATANNEINPPGGPLVVNLPMGSYRVDRIRTVLAAEPGAGIDAMRRLQLDVYSVQAERFMELFRPLIPSTSAGELLRAWDHRYDRASRGATLFELVYEALLERVFGEGLFGIDSWHEIVTQTTILADFYHVFDDVLLGGDPDWFGQAGRETLIRETLETTLGTIDPEKVSPWGERRQIVMANVLLGGQLPRWLGFDHGPVQLEGNRATVVQATVFVAHERTTSFYPSWRFITDMSKPEALTVLAGGPSGNRLSKWYTTDVRKWLDGDYKVLRLGS
jgi:penicillin amidase